MTNGFEPVAAFRQHYGRPPLLEYRVPVQCNLMGEVCALTQGFLLCCAENRFCDVMAAPRSDSRIQLRICDRQGTALNATEDPAHRTTLEALTAVLDSLQQRGYRLSGLDLLMVLPEQSGIPQLIETAKMALAFTLNHSAELGLSAAGLVKLCANGPLQHPGEQVAALAARRNHCLLVDCDKFSWQGIPMPEQLSLLRVNLGNDTDHFSRQRTLQHERTRQITRYFALSSLRELSLERLNQARQSLSAELFGCARHLLSEQQRALSLADALVERRLHEIGPLMHSAHLSLKREFGFECRAADLMVTLLEKAAQESGGARLLSNGEVIALIPKERKTAIIDHVTQEYAQRFGLYATFFNIDAASGAHSVR